MLPYVCTIYWLHEGGVKLSTCCLLLYIPHVMRMYGGCRGWEEMVNIS